MAKNYEDMNNDMIIMLSALGDQDARAERLIREIMDVDSLEWKDARIIFKSMARFNRTCMMFPALPYKIGIATAVGI
jgi:hypothetical protein